MATSRNLTENPYRTSAATLDTPLGMQSGHAEHQVRRAARALCQSEIAFVNSEDLCDVSEAHQQVLDEVFAPVDTAGEAPRELPAHLRRMCNTTLLTAEQEQALFKEMNLLKHRANSLRSQVDVDAENLEKLSDQVEEIESLLASAKEVREHLVKANMRLVMSIVKKFVTRQHSFDDLLSEGTFTLMQAVEKFDYSRGFRFSTYAYRSIVRSIYRLIANAQKEDERVTLVSEEWPFETQEGEDASSLNDQVWSNLRELTAAMMENLDRRERMIIRCRYALGAHRKVTTFQAIADRLGVSKERVRQLEQRAVNKLRAMASEYEMDELFGAAMV